MTRWLVGALGLGLVLGMTTGCNRQCFLNKEVFDQANSGLLLPNLDEPGAYTHAPITAQVPTPPNVSSPDRPARPLSLQEALAIALENGTASGRAGAGQGIYDTNLSTNPPVFGSSTAQVTTGQTDFIRVLALQPAISGANVEAAVARFDAQYITSMNWTATDELQQGLQSFQNGQTASFVTGIVKGLATGGTAGITFGTDYRTLSNPPTGTFTVLNPQYTTRLTFGIEQPLLQNFGTSINQLLGNVNPLQSNVLPGTVAQGYNARRNNGLLNAGFVSSDGILIARLRFDQQRAEFERNVQMLMLNTEASYWKLYQAYGRLYAFEEVLRIAHRAWMIGVAQYQNGKIGPADFAPIRAQYEEFRGERTAALGDVLDKERNLRGIIGLPMEDGTRLIPITPPTLAPYQPDWQSALHDALNLRPELIVVRENLRLAQYNLEVARNFLKPDLRFSANYSPVGFGTRLDGRDTFIDGTGTPRPSNAFQSLASDHFNDWTVGLTLNMPIGFRFENAAVRSARLSLIQSAYLLKDQEQRATSFLAQQYQKIEEWQRLIEERRAERKAYAEAVEARFRKYQAGQVTPDFLLDSQRRLAAAFVKEFEAVAEYNNSLTRFEWAKGTIMKYNNVHIAEGALPYCAQVRAVEHEKERSRAIVLRERPAPITHPGMLASPTEAPPLADPIRTVPLNDVTPPPDGAVPPGGTLPTLPPAPRELPEKLGEATLPAPTDGKSPATDAKTPADAKAPTADAKAPASDPTTPSAESRMLPPRPGKTADKAPTSSARDITPATGATPPAATATQAGPAPTRLPDPSELAEPTFRPSPTPSPDAPPAPFNLPGANGVTPSLLPTTPTLPPSPSAPSQLPPLDVSPLTSPRP
jgi:outer membrane protein TolC